MRVLIISLFGIFLAAAWGEDAEDSFKVGAGEWSASTGFGYKENVLFSEIAPVDSPFIFASVEGIASHEFIETGGEWTTMLLLDNYHFTKASDLPDETFGLLLSEYGRYVTIDGRLSGGVQYVYFKQAFDATFDVLDPNQIVLTGQEPKLYLDWKAFFWQFEYQATVGASRMYFKNPTNDYETIDWELELDYLLGEESRVLLAANGHARDYTDRLARTLSGSRADSIVLGEDQVGIELAYERPFGFLGVMGELELGIDFEARRDRHFGYYDRDSLKYGLEWSGRGERWDFRLDLGYAQRDYLLQTVDSGSLRTSDEWIWTVDLERELSDHWGLFLRLNRDQSDSNETYFSYDTNSVMLGLRLK
jgi:hypothetical protein